MEFLKNKVVMLGEAGVGKTALVSRFTLGMFNSDQAATIGSSFTQYLYENDDISQNVQIWDTAGSEVFQSMTPIYVQNAFGALIVFDLTQSDGLSTIRRWYDFVPEDIPKIIIGNKSDLETQRKISYEDGYKIAQELNCEYLETSASNGNCVDEAFLRIMHLGFETLKHKVENAPKVLDLRPKETKGSCCT